MKINDLKKCLEDEEDFVVGDSDDVIDYGKEDAK